MKNIFLLAIIAIFAASCSNDTEINNQVNNNVEQAAVRVHVDGFSVSQEDFSGTRAGTDVANYNGINAVTLAFYKSDGTEAYKSTQAKGDTGFGEFSLSLPMGSYTMVALAYHTSDGNPLVLSSPTVAEFTGAHSFETFAYTQAVNITNTSAVDISATLSRIISQLKVVSTDGKTADVANVRMTFSSGGKDFNPSTGFAITNTGYVNTVGNSYAVGATSTSLSYFFLATDVQNINVTIETLDADGHTLFSKTVANVPFKRNRRTVLTGPMYTNTSTSGSFQVDAEWLTDENVNF